MALVRLNVPSLLLYGGSIMPGHFHDKEVTIRSVYEDRKPVCGAVVIRSEVETLPVGRRIACDSQIVELPTITDDLLTFSDSASNYETITYSLGDSIIEAAFERIVPPVQLYIFGAGADAVPLVGDDPQTTATAA